MTEAEFKKAMSRLVTGVTLIATRPDPNGPARALTVNSFTSVSLSPPIIQWCLDRTGGSWRGFANIETFSVNVLAMDHHQHAQDHTHPQTQYLNEDDITVHVTGAPVLISALAIIDCRVRRHIEMGDHRVFFADVAGVASSDGAPLCYYRGAFGRFEPI